MYCINCGVKLEDGEKCCPLCSTPVFHPDIKKDNGGERLYPEFHQAEKRSYRPAVMFIITVIWALAALLPLIVDIQLTSGISWSGFVLGGMATLYIPFILPWWFKRPNSVIFTPITFAAVILYLLYIDLVVGGGWFLSFAFPVAGIAGLIITTVVVLFKYLRSGYLFISGGAVIATGIYTVLIELFLWLTFDVKFVMWSLYPLISCTFIGLMLIVIGASRPMKEALQKKFFI